MSQNNLIETIYEVFGKYTLNGRIDKCPCGCISYEEENKIYSKPLRELENEDIGFYCGKAMTTWGNEADFKHFLPRLLELSAKEKYNSWYDLDTIYNKLEYAAWKDWNKEEQDCIYKFVENEWKKIVNLSLNEINNFDFEQYLHFFEFDDLLTMWNITNNSIAVENMVNFIYYHGIDIFYSNKKLKINKIDRTNNLLDFIQKTGFIQKLEESYFENADVDAEYSDKISTVLQMLETTLEK